MRAKASLDWELKLRLDMRDQGWLVGQRLREIVFGRGHGGPHGVLAINTLVLGLSGVYKSY